jgi:uncharacterized protein (TIGR02147 family)
MRNTNTRPSRKGSTIASAFMGGAQGHLRMLLIKEFQNRKSKNPSYSLRAFARYLDLFPSALSELLNAKRPVSVRVGEKILQRLPVSADEMLNLLSALKKGAWERKARRTPWDESLDSAFTHMDMDSFRLVSDWYYFGILSLAETAGFRDDAAWVSARLGITVFEAKDGLQRLTRLGLLRPNQQGQLAPTGAQLATTTDIPNIALRRSLHQNLDLARLSLDRDGVNARDFSSITMAIDPARISEAKKLIKKFRRNLCRLLESGEKKEVYNLNIELFPLTLTEGIPK